VTGCQLRDYYKRISQHVGQRRQNYFLLRSHMMDGGKKVADRIVLIDDGRIA